MAYTPNPNPVTQNGKPDRRYEVRREWTGHAKPHYVARFCGEWIGSSQFYSSAVMQAVGHNARRLGALTFENIPA